MYTCPKCMAVYFIDITGQPEFGDMSVPVPIQTEITTEQSDENIHHDFQSEIMNEVSNDLLTDNTLDSNFTADLNSEINPFELPQVPIDSSEFGNIANQITDFGNQDNSVSALSYDLKITGLDTKETMSLFKEALEDSKFGWITKDIFAKIKNGECELTDLNPIQAYVLAKRIQFMDIEMQWKQNVQI